MNQALRKQHTRACEIIPIGFSGCNNARALMHGFCLDSDWRSNGNVEHVMKRSWRARVGKSGAYHKSGSRRRKGKERGVGTRGIGGVRGKEKKGESGEQAGPLPTPICSTVCIGSNFWKYKSVTGHTHQSKEATPTN